MKNHISHSNNSITQLLNDLEQMQHYLLMVKAAALAPEKKAKSKEEDTTIRILIGRD